MYTYIFYSNPIFYIQLFYNFKINPYYTFQNFSWPTKNDRQFGNLYGPKSKWLILRSFNYFNQVFWWVRNFAQEV